jgi:DNA-binding MarR family transcriptional regulator
LREIVRCELVRLVAPEGLDELLGMRDGALVDRIGGDPGCIPGRAMSSLESPTTAIALPEVVAALSLATDLAMGQPLESGLAVCRVALALAEEATVSKLAGLLDLDRTTMTRNLGPLERRRLVASVAGDDARNRILRLTEKGRATLGAALPIWERVQARVVRGLGDARWKGMLRDLEATTSLARSA